jgi:hypothetical protein
MASFVRLQKLDNPEATDFVHEPIPLCAVALTGVHFGYRFCFSDLPNDLSSHRTLFATYEFLQVDVLGGKSLDEVVSNLRVEGEKRGQDRTDFHTRLVPLRKTAYQLLYGILHA